MFGSLGIAKKLAGGFGVILLLMIVISAIVFVKVTDLVESAKWVNHTYEVIRNAEQVGAAMVDMETGQRGFMIAGKDDYLEPFKNGGVIFDKLVVHGQELTADNPEQVARWQAVAGLKARWLAEAAEPEIAARRNVSAGEAAVKHFREVSSRTVGKEIFDSIRAALASLDEQFAARGNQSGRHLVTEITLALVNMETGQRGYLLSGKEASLAPYKQGLSDLKALLPQLLRESQSSADMQALVNQVEARVQAWMDQAAEPEIDARRAMNAHDKTMDHVAAMMANGPGKVIMDSLRSTVREIVAAEEVLIGVRAAEQQAISTFTISFTLIGTLIAIVLGSAVATYVIRGIAVPIKQTNVMLKDIAEGDGDLTKRIPVNSKDEIGELGENFNHFVIKLQGIMSQIADSSIQLANSTEELAATTAQTSVGVSKQKQETELVATAMNQMATTVQQVAQDAEAASGAAGEADQAAVGGRQVVGDTMKAISGLAREVDKSAEVIGKLRGDSDNIGTVLDVIKNIAEQTNLLALNAAIEAARAGEQGRGFAVVADEVRTLAQRTQSSTQEIEALIEALQNGAERAVSVMGKSRDQAQEAVTKAEQAGESLTSITTAVSTILQMNTQIAAAVEEQAAVTDEVNRNVANIQEVSEQTAAGAEETSSASAALARLGTQMNTLVGQFRL